LLLQNYSYFSGIYCTADNLAVMTRALQELCEHLTVHVSAGRDDNTYLRASFRVRGSHLGAQYNLTKSRLREG
jgi:hypothetical protein